jgi:hypothetical protein
MTSKKTAEGKITVLRIGLFIAAFLVFVVDAIWITNEAKTARLIAIGLALLTAAEETSKSGRRTPPAESKIHEEQSHVETETEN